MLRAWDILGRGYWRLAQCALFLALPLLTAPLSAAPCRQALALGLDVSGSVDDREYRLQLDGIAAALLQPDVLSILTSQPQAPVSIAIFEWSGPDNQNILVPWTRIQSAQDAQDVATKLNQQRRRPGDPSTAMGKALIYGADLLRNMPGCWQHTLDLSADGMSNSGPRPVEVAEDLARNPVLVNGLVIAPDGRGDQQGLDQLTRYFEEWVIRGPFSFVEQAAGYEDYANAMARKLLRELSGLPLSEALQKNVPEVPSVTAAESRPEAPSQDVSTTSNTRLRSKTPSQQDTQAH
ncbi:MULTISPECIES: DUF1194 domain-containing protein [unclassified Aliiroseovarius]|uniref:DUF1194 domain-containing protein n=1 Tax=unclassified Aliiroseovarius TaxID=2623558 RepID=UPI001568113C|nr:MULTISPECIES: DUF1194 domain-containing protein [unclassified Aliiroseovarius]NRP32032.1 hypothetical protein [Aliiroseovarius sp. xm-m-314]NRP45921.1 hypothetical protein [Aliiroseovarius sp. xm-m-378]NRP66789.1 hypothetical protein [Aliiroseovarius sp. xm-v-225]NRP81674.1 hypothetical protein [Aliiroseovarius sp. xm-v-209]NRP93853.1 hypothetical protein [Aliiroseovarius sp. xm-a-134]